VAGGYRSLTGIMRLKILEC